MAKQKQPPKISPDNFYFQFSACNGYFEFRSFPVKPDKYGTEFHIDEPYILEKNCVSIKEIGDNGTIYGLKTDEAFAIMKKDVIVRRVSNKGLATPHVWVGAQHSVRCPICGSTDCYRQRISVPVNGTVVEMKTKHCLSGVKEPELFYLIACACRIRKNNPIYLLIMPFWLIGKSQKLGRDETDIPKKCDDCHHDIKSFSTEDEYTDCRICKCRIYNYRYKNVKVRDVLSSEYVLKTYDVAFNILSQWNRGLEKWFEIFNEIARMINLKNISCETMESIGKKFFEYSTGKTLGGWNHLKHPEYGTAGLLFSGPHMTEYFLEVGKLFNKRECSFTYLEKVGFLLKKSFLENEIRWIRFAHQGDRTENLVRRQVEENERLHKKCMKIFEGMGAD